jgi:hypothetical protein
MPDGQRTQMREASAVMEESLFSWPRHEFNFQPICHLKRITEGTAGTAQLSS